MSTHGDTTFDTTYFLAFMQTLREYCAEQNHGRKAEKRHILYELIRKYYLEYDDRVCIAMGRHGLSMHIER